MKYQVSINEKSKPITVDLDGYKGTAKCSPTDRFNITTGIELALERAKVAKANAEKLTPTAEPMGVMELVKALEKALPKGQMVIVGNGNYMTAEQKKWLHSLTDCDGGCSCDCDCDGECECYTDEDIEDIKAEAYEDGYDVGYDEGYDRGRADGYDEGRSDGYDEGYADGEDEDYGEELAERIREVLEDYED